jgi:hypothetical protein
MTILIDGLNLRLYVILNKRNTDIHGHEIVFEKTDDLEYSSLYIINCNRKYVIDLSSVIVTIREMVIPDDDVLYTDISNTAIKIEEKLNMDVTS